jgi:hypothetical protein
VSEWSDEFERGHFHGIHDERERIIKLLKEEGSSIFSLLYVIALIKGESNMQKMQIANEKEKQVSAKISAFQTDQYYLGYEHGYQSARFKRSLEKRYIFALGLGIGVSFSLVTLIICLYFV